MITPDADELPPFVASPAACDSSRVAPELLAALAAVLPHMLPDAHCVTGCADPPFSAMPEAMPPPPLRLVLPPELEPDRERRGIMRRLFGRDL